MSAAPGLADNLAALNRVCIRQSTTVNRYATHGQSSGAQKYPKRPEPPRGCRSDADPNVVKALDKVLDCLADEMLAHLRDKRPFKDNSLLLALTWSFGRCPLIVQKQMLRAAEALFSGRIHPLLAPNVQSRKALIHGLGRVLKEPDLLIRFLDLVLSMQLTGNSPAALASVLGRPEATPRLLTEERMARAAFNTANYLDHLKRELDFKLGLKYGLNIVAGLLRCREERPFAFLRASSRDAVRLWTILARIHELLGARRAKFNQSDQKLVIIESLLEMLDGSGGKRETFIQIEDLSDSEGSDGGSTIPAV